MSRFDPADSAICAAADLMPVMVAAVDGDGTYHYVNRVYSAYFGIPPEALIGRRVGDNIPLEDDIDDDRRRRVLRSCIDTGGEQEIVLRIRRPDGDLRKLVARLVGDPERQICYAFVNDVTHPDVLAEGLETSLVRRLARRY